MSQQLADYVTLRKELLLLEREAEHAENALVSEAAKLSALESSGVSLEHYIFH